MLAEASSRLGESIDYETTLATVAALLVPSLADGCVIDVVEPDGSIARIAAVHVDPAKATLMAALRNLPPPSADATIHRVIAMTEPQIIEAPPDDEMWRRAARSPEHFEILRSLGIVSGMTIALRSRGVPTGVLWIFSSSARAYTKDEITLAGELASRAATSIENARLYRRAEDAVQLRDDFLSVASHEFNTPLASLRLLVDSLGKMPHETRVQARIERVDRQVQRLERLVRQLLDVAQLVRGRALTASTDDAVTDPVVAEDVDLADVVRETMALLDEELARGGRGGARIEVTLDLPPDDAPMDARAIGAWDRVRVEQVFFNLVTNAIKYGAGKPIDIALRGLGAHVEMTVTDHGIGVAPEDQGRIFRRFERAVSPRNYGGLGLGLFVAHEIVTALGGSIAVDSAVGRGSTFRVRLPRARGSKA